MGTLDDLIEYEGVTKSIPNNIRSFKTIQLDREILIPNNKPNINGITRVRVNVRTSNGRLVKTATGKALSGKRLTGWKYYVKVNFKGIIEYVDDNFYGNLISFSWMDSINEYITLHEDSNFHDDFIDGGFIENINIEVLNERRVWINISSLIIAENREL